LLVSATDENLDQLGKSGPVEGPGENMSPAGEIRHRDWVVEGLMILCTSHWGK
jgi:hypothetical protein